MLLQLNLILVSIPEPLCIIVLLVLYLTGRMNEEADAMLNHLHVHPSFQVHLSVSLFYQKLEFHFLGHVSCFAKQKQPLQFPLLLGQYVHPFLLNLSQKQLGLVRSFLLKLKNGTLVFSSCCKIVLHTYS